MKSHILHTIATLLIVFSTSATFGQNTKSLTLPSSEDILRLSVEHPEETRAGRSYEYQVTVANVSNNITVHDLKLTQRTDGSLSVESATIDGKKQSNKKDKSSQDAESKQASKDSGRSREWTIAKLEPGQSKTVKVSAVSDAEGSANLCFSITSYTPTLCIKPRFVRPEVQLTKNAPEQVSLCEVIHYEYKVTNTGSGDPGTFEIVDKLGDLQTESGDQTLRFKVDGLEPGETRIFVADIVATKSGEFSSRAEAILKKDERVKSKSTTTKVVSPQLAVAIDGPKMVYADRPVQYTVRISNNGNADANRVGLRLRYPTQMEMANVGRVSSSSEAVKGTESSNSEPTPAKEKEQKQEKEQDKKNRQNQKRNPQNEDQVAMESRDIDIDNLKVGATKEVTFTLRGNIDQVLPVRAVATFVCQPGDSDETYEVSSTAARSTEVVSLPALLVAVIDERDPVQVEDEVVYEIIVRNQGNAADRNVQIEAELPKQLEFISADGPTDASKPNGKKVAFGKLDSMAPGEKAVWRVKARAADKGDTRFKVHLTSESLSEPATSEEPTRLFGGDTEPKEDEAS